MNKYMSMIGVALVAALPLAAHAQPVPIVGLMELSGTGATAGTNFDNGVKLAVKEINAAGGILGRKIEYTSMDTQTAPQTAKALAQKAVDMGAYVVMGPVFSAISLVPARITTTSGRSAITSWRKRSTICGVVCPLIPRFT